MTAFDAFALAVAVAAGTLRVATPLILCALAGLFSERSGVVDIGLEGKTLAAAFGAAACAAATGSAPLGLAAGIASACALALLHGFAAITHGGNQVVSGMAINILASGLTAVFGEAWFRKGGQTPALAAEARFMPLTWPRGLTSDNAAVDLVLTRLVGGHGILVYATLAAVPLAAFVLARTRFGLRLRAVGEAPGAAETAGISVPWVRYRAVLVCGVLTGLAGAYLSLAQNAGFNRDMTAGQGYIALAALVFGKWRAGSAFAACLMFGFIDAVAIRLQGVSLPGVGEVPVQLFQALPYGLTVVLLAGFIGRATPPKALGIPFRPGG